MKNKMNFLLASMVVGIMLTGCGHEHTWVEANCTTPKTCSECGETEGEALGHTFEDATCTTAKTCSVCGDTEGSPLGHTWIDATFDDPQTCSVCGETEGEPLEKTIEYLFANELSDLYAEIQESENTQLENYLDICSSVVLEVYDNDIEYVYTYTEGIDYSSFDLTDEAFSSQNATMLRAINSYEDCIGVRPTSLSYVYNAYDGTEVYRYTYYAD